MCIIWTYENNSLHCLTEIKWHKTYLLTNIDIAIFGQHSIDIVSKLNLWYRPIPITNKYSTPVLLWQQEGVAYTCVFVYTRYIVCRMSVRLWRFKQCVIDCLKQNNTVALRWQRLIRWQTRRESCGFVSCVRSLLIFSAASAASLSIGLFWFYIWETNRMTLFCSLFNERPLYYMQNL